MGGRGISNNQSSSKFDTWWSTASVHITGVMIIDLVYCDDVFLRDPAERGFKG